MNLAEYIHSRLSELSYDVVFGVPGSYIMPLWQKFGESPRVVLACHESGAVFMADGWARMCAPQAKKPGIVLTTIGPGQTNMCTGIAGAYKDSIPLVVISGQGNPESAGRGTFQECYPVDRGFSPHDLFAPITKGSFEVTDCRQGVYLFEHALHLACAGRPGPVHLSIPLSVQCQEIPNQLLTQWNLDKVKTQQFNLATGSAEVIERLQIAQRPLILAGWGVYLAGQMLELENLAIKLNAPIITSIKGLAGVRFSQNLVWGHIGPGHNPTIIKMIADYQPDLVLILGASLSAYYYDQVRDLLNPAYCIQVDIDAALLGLRAKIDLSISTDLAFWLPAITQQLSHQPKPAEDRGRSRLAQTLLAKLNSGQYLMAQSIYELNHLLPQDAIVIPDAGNHWLNVLSCYSTRAFGGFMTNPGLGAMGYAIGAAIGMKLAKPKRRIVCITGDGSTMMSGNEISVATHMGLDNIFIIYNNCSMGRVRIGQHYDYAKSYIASDLPEIDFASWAESIGAIGMKVRSLAEFKVAVNQALLTENTTVIEVIVSKDEEPICFTM